LGSLEREFKKKGGGAKYETKKREEKKTREGGEGKELGGETKPGARP